MSPSHQITSLSQVGLWNILGRSPPAGPVLRNQNKEQADKSVAVIQHGIKTYDPRRHWWIEGPWGPWHSGLVFKQWTKTKRKRIHTNMEWIYLFVFSCKKVQIKTDRRRAWRSTFRWSFARMQGDLRVPLMHNRIKSQDAWLEHVNLCWRRGVETSKCGSDVVG